MYLEMGIAWSMCTLINWNSLITVSLPFGVTSKKNFALEERAPEGAPRRGGEAGACKADLRRPDPI
jgi:hypothetical protein